MKYEINEDGRIVALKDFGKVKKGDVGGFVEGYHNLSQEGNCWIFDRARVFENALVSGNAEVYDDAQIYDNTLVSGNARIYGNSWLLHCDISEI